MQEKYITILGLALAFGVSTSTLSAVDSFKKTTPTKSESPSKIQIGSNRTATPPLSTVQKTTEKVTESKKQETTPKKLPTCDYSRKTNCAPVCNPDGSSSDETNPAKCVLSSGSKKEQAAKLLGTLTEGLKNQDHSVQDTTRDDYIDPKTTKPQITSKSYSGPADTSSLGF